MKIIDLLNKIANGEEVPEIIKYNNFIYKYDKDICDYGGDDLYLFDNTDKLNDEVEILEEEKKIPEKLKKKKTINGSFEGKTTCIYKYNEYEIGETINEIIDYLDYLKSKGE